MELWRCTEAASWPQSGRPVWLVWNRHGGPNGF